MREILFRGQRVDNGEWIEGALFEGEKFCIIGQEIKFSPYVKNECKIVGFEVIPETVGQYTGLKDKNGVKIFEGDVLEYQYFRNNKIVGQVVWGEYNQSKCDEYGCTHYGWHLDKAERDYYEDTGIDIAGDHITLEVVGNAFDNPELLGGDKK